MGRRKCRRWNSCLVWFLTSVGALFYTINSISATTEALYREGGEFYEPSCPANRQLGEEKFLMVVSTLDGKVSALDVKNSGELLWSFHADSQPLLSSSISKLEITRNGMRTRLIPSLDGGLYQYDGESIEAIPMTAESLLRSTFTLSDRTMMVGGKDIKSYGINPATGDMQYICSSENCKVLGESENTDDLDMLVITRSTQTVRAVDARNGLERWNFSVGQHQMELLKGNKVIEENVNSEDDAFIQDCPGKDDVIDGVADENSLKIIVPEGMVVSLSPDNSDLVLWKYKFESPIANAWLINKGVMKQVSVFDNKHVPALSAFLPPDEKMAPEPLLYVGMHQNQLYVQPSASMQENVASAARSRSANNVPRVAWKPYLISAPSRTPILRGNRKGDVPRITDNEDKVEGSLVVWHENYPFDNGYYLYPDVTLPTNYSGEEFLNMTVDVDSIYTPLWFYWKEVTALSLLMSLGVNLLLRRCRKFYKKRKESEVSLSLDGKVNDSGTSVNSLAEKKTEDYSSRYEADFLQVQCLGKGGFGIVFEAVNKVDECSYAIKRISIPNSDSARDKVMREVRALAKLDHSGIVRYFHAWWESPPPGWQETKDRHLEEYESISMPSSPCDTTTHNRSVSLSQVKSQNYDLQNPFGGANTGEISGLTRNKKAGGSTEFSVTESSISLDASRSEPFLFGSFNENTINEEDESLDVEFRLDDSEDSGSCSNNIPFTKLTGKSQIHHDTNNSFSIVFEDSGCADKSSPSSSGGIVFANSSDNNSAHTKSSQSDKYIIDISTSHDHQTSSNVITSHSKLQKKGGDPENSGKATPGPKLYLFIQMQLCRRDTLKDWLSDNSDSRDSRLVLDIFDQIISAVDYVHDCGLMHRDLKPSNIFFSLDGIVKIGDFGLVTALSEEEREQCSENGNPYKRHTAQVGTTLYMSPEQVAGKSYGHKVDIFSLGMILFELLHPFSTQMERVRTMMDIKKGIFPVTFCEQKPTEKKYVEWLLSDDPVNRPSTKQIIDSKLLKEFQHRHISGYIRTRTISSSSNGSVS